jgi:hypothetical protein
MVLWDLRKGVGNRFQETEDNISDGKAQKKAHKVLQPERGPRTTAANALLWKS